jgi:hypothetical protein
VSGLARAIALAAVLSVSGAATAWAGELPALPPDFSAANQYVESVPTSHGPKGGAASGGRSLPLPAGVRRKLRGSGDVERVATSAALGAPTQKLDTSHGKRHSKALPSAALGALDEGTGPGVLWWALLAAVTLALAGGAYLRHRHRSVGARS